MGKQSIVRRDSGNQMVNVHEDLRAQSEQNKETILLTTKHLKDTRSKCDKLQEQILVLQQQKQQKPGVALQMLQGEGNGIGRGKGRGGGGGGGGGSGSGSGSSSGTANAKRPSRPS